MFGLGVGYQLEQLLDEHTVEKLFICEPNPDFFYASLFAIDWQTIFETVEQSETRIYLNIGDDGTNLFRDLLSQFYAIGPYILNSTYFYQSYYNASLNSAISQLREQLQVVISMGEYFDHAYYGIAHTTEGMRRKIPVLAANPANKLSYDEKEVPIFIVGNGPSLDGSIETIKEWQGQAIVVSCGTALQALYRYGITPDFHAEIEQNRSTYDWAVLIGDLEYLKNITLISCNGIHPDTCDLYKDVMIAFKEGESSTVSALNVLGRKNFTTLLNAFPTVSNFAIDLFSTIGFTSIYLIGVDLGFVDVKHHHSKSSGYYQEDGKETYDFTKSANTSLIVPGNFRPKVNTKHEFKVSRQVIEQVTSSKPQDQAFYNCSDGAKIAGTLPIKPDELLIVVTKQQKTQIVEKLKTLIFSSKQLGNYVEKFEKHYSQTVLIEELGDFEKLLEKEITSKDDAEKIITKQKEMLFASYKNGQSLLFYYLYGTVNYANAVLIKLLSGTTAPPTVELIQCQQKWSNKIYQVKQMLSTSGQVDFDTSYFNALKRELTFLELNDIDESMLVVTDSKEFKASILIMRDTYFSWLRKFEVITNQQSQNYGNSPDYVIYDLDPADTQNLIKGNNGTLVLTDSVICTNLEYKGVTYIQKCIIENDTVESNNIQLAHFALRCSLGSHQSPVIIRKYRTSEASLFCEKPVAITTEKYIFYDFIFYVCIYRNTSVSSQLKETTKGTRGKREQGPVKMKHLLYSVNTTKNLQDYATHTAELIESHIEKNKDLDG
jgi:hypothetical protein